MDSRKRAKAATPERYLWDKPGALHLWFRLAVPVRYHPVEERRIVQRCLGTRDRREASLKAARLRADLNSQWQAKLAEITSARSTPAGTGIAPSKSDLEQAATEAAYVRMRPKLEKAWQVRRGTSVTAHEDFIRDLKSTRDRYIATKETTTLPQWERMAEKRIAENVWSLPKSTPEYDSFVQMVAEAAIEVLRVELERRSGNFGAEPTSKVVTSGLTAIRNTAAAGETLAELFERYASQRLAEKRKRLDTVNQDRKIILEFAAFVGAGRSVRSIAKADVREWRDCVAVVPAGFRVAKAYSGLSLRHAAAKARSIPATPISSTTLNKYLSTLSPFLRWCVANGYADTNPCDGLFYSAVKGKNRRPSFTSEQLCAIFRSPLFTGFAADGQEHVVGTRRTGDWRYWIPLVCLFTGARTGEVAQLEIGDVGFDDAIPFLTIRHNEATGQQTKSGRTRIAPIHSELVSLGFLNFVEAQRRRAAKDSNHQLFPSLCRDGRQQMGTVPSRFWRDYLKRIGVKRGRDGIGSHSFRHTLIDRLRTAGYFNDEIAVAVGHRVSTTTSGYGSIDHGTVGRLSRMIEAVSFPELKADR